jgi:hypothetical protein
MGSALDWPIIGGLIEGLNWLTITTPFIAGFAAYNWGQAANEGKAVPAFVGMLAFIGLVAIWYILYKFIAFPLWMGWFQ